MGIIGFVDCLHQRQQGTVQRLSAAERGSVDRLLDQPRGDLRCRSGLTGQGLTVDRGMVRW